MIALPNQIDLHKQYEPRVLELYNDILEDQLSGEERLNLVKSKKQNAVYLEKYYEDRLHQECVIAARNMGIQAFAIQGFQSASCLNAKLEKCRKSRENDEFGNLNQHERDMMEILEIKDIEQNG